MANPFNNKEYLIHLKLLGLLGTVLFMFFLTYLLVWNPYTLYFDRPEFSSTPYDRRQLFSGLAALFNFVILFGLTLSSIIMFWKRKKFVIWTPLFGVLTLILLLQMNKFYPDSQHEYTKDEFRYLEQRWYHDGVNTFKRFKSEKPLSDYSNHNQIIWELDSIGR